jgi:hypothetical protein
MSMSDLVTEGELEWMRKVVLRPAGVKERGEGGGESCGKFEALGYKRDSVISVVKA